MSPREPPFTVTCHAGFDESGVWVIDARLRWRDDPPPIGSSFLMGLGRVALLEAIAREGLRGRSLGAMKVRVRMEGHQVGGVETLGEPERDPDRPA